MEVEHEQIWATGFFEAQGYASYHVDRKRGTLTYQLVIHNGDPQLLHEFAKTLGVPFGLKKVSRNSLRLTVNGSDAFGAAKVLRRYCKGKNKDILELFIAARLDAPPRDDKADVAERRQRWQEKIEDLKHGNSNVHPVNVEGGSEEEAVAEAPTAVVEEKPLPEKEKKWKEIDEERDAQHAEIASRLQTEGWDGPATLEKWKKEGALPPEYAEEFEEEREGTSEAGGSPSQVEE